MPLMDHLRELRRRVFICVLCLIPGTIIGWVYYDTIVQFLADPVCDVDVKGLSDGDTCGPLVINGLLGPFNLQVKVSLATGVALSAPVWLAQLWGVRDPRAAPATSGGGPPRFLAAGVPLFFAGAALCYWILPKATKLLLGFTPEDVRSIVDFNEYLSIVMRLMLVFGLAFEVPVFIILLNLLGILPAARLASWWRQIIFGVFLFAAVATPTGDPLTMTSLAAPLCLLILGAYFICRIHDKRAGNRDIDYGSPVRRRDEPAGHDAVSRRRRHLTDQLEIACARAP